MLPPEFQFLGNHPDFEEMDADEIHNYIEAHFARIRAKAAVLREHGVDAEKLIAFLEPNLRNLEKAQRKVDEAEQQQLGERLWVRQP